IKEDASNIKEDASNIKEDASDFNQETINLGQSLKETANRFYDKYKKEFESKDYENRLSEMKQNLASKGVDEKQLGMSMGEYAKLVVTMQVMGEIHKEGKLSPQDAKDYEKFVGDYDKYSNLLGEKSNIANYTKDNSVYYNNSSVKEYINSEPKTKLNLDGVDETLIKQFGFGEQAQDQGTQFISNMFRLNGNKQVFNNYMDMIVSKFDRITGNNLNSDKLGDVNVNPNGNRQSEFNMGYNLEGYDLQMKIDEKGTVFMTDLLGDSKGGLGISQSTIDDILPPNDLVEIPTLGDYEQALGTINFPLLLEEIKYYLKTPNDELDVKNNELVLLNAFNNKLNAEFDKKNPQGKGESYADEQLNNVVTDQQVAGYLINVYPDKAKVQQYKSGLKLSEQQDPKMFKYFDLLKNTLDFQSTQEKLTTKELFDNIQNTLNDPTIHTNPNYKILNSLFPPNNDGDSSEFIKIIDSFTEYKGGEKIIDIMKLEKFYQSVLKQDKRELKSELEEDENPDDLLASLNY
ncbi:MAG: hypothetical protein V3575_01440, partial [Candidatus Absconditabacteria bacterium]